MTERCDVIMTRGRDVYINGTKIGCLVEAHVDRDVSLGPPGDTRLTLELRPTSVIYGEVPSETVEAMKDSPDVDIEKAIEKAQQRVSAGVARPMRSRQAKGLLCNAGVGGGEVCSLHKDHTGPHAS
jgi:hypothetical protein